MRNHIIKATGLLALLAIGLSVGGCGDCSLMFDSFGVIRDINCPK